MWARIRVRVWVRVKVRVWVRVRVWVGVRVSPVLDTLQALHHCVGLGVKMMHSEKCDTLPFMLLFALDLLVTHSFQISIEYLACLRHVRPLPGTLISVRL